MDDLILEELLAQQRAAPLPSLPGSFQREVWRAIRLQKAALARSRNAWVAWFVEPLFHPAMLFSALSLAAILGIGLGVVLMDHSATQTRLALDLQVFGIVQPQVQTTSTDFTE